MVVVTSVGAPLSLKGWYLAICTASSAERRSISGPLTTCSPVMRPGPIDYRREDDGALHSGSLGDGRVCRADGLEQQAGQDAGRDLERTGGLSGCGLRNSQDRAADSSKSQAGRKGTTHAIPARQRRRIARGKRRIGVRDDAAPTRDGWYGGGNG